jgi:hypothetical protein
MKMRDEETDGWKSVVCRGVCLRWSVVRSGFGSGGCGRRWWREIVFEGPEEMMRGRVGWAWRQVIADYYSIRHGP